MLVKVKTIAKVGIDPVGVEAEVNLFSRGMPYFDIVGLTGKTIEESKHRIRAAIINSGLDFPDKRIIVNLAPADIPKEGSLYDFPVAAGILSCILNKPLPTDALFFGEVSLDGSLRYTRGVFLLATYAKEKRIKNIYVPDSCANEAAVFETVKVYGVKSLCQFYEYIKGDVKSLRYTKVSNIEVDTGSVQRVETDISNVIGQLQAKRALEISAAGGHNLMLMGPPGVGKTFLAKAYPTLLTNLTKEESFEVTKVYSASGHEISNGSLITERPFRSPHHTISYVGMVGGGYILRPGEVSLAHNGVLFMDEFSEFSRQVIEALRQPLEDGEIEIVRGKYSTKLPCRFTLIAASNVCPCGPKGECVCSKKQIENYRKKLSGPILDRIDLFVHVDNIDLSQFVLNIQNTQETKEFIQAENSEDIKKRVYIARQVQLKRFSGSNVYTNSKMNNSQVYEFCKLTRYSEEILREAAIKLNISVRAYFKVLKVARTIADLSSEELILDQHIMEALQLRFKL